MKMKKKWGVIVLLLGVIFLAGSFYIKGQVEEGNQKVAKTEKQMDLGDKLFSITPETKEIGKGISGSVDKKLIEGKEQIAFYTSMADWLEIAGVVFIILGMSMILFGKK